MSLLPAQSKVRANLTGCSVELTRVRASRACKEVLTSAVRRLRTANRAMLAQAGDFIGQSLSRGKSASHMVTYGNAVKSNDSEELGAWHAPCTLASASLSVSLGESATGILLDAALGVLTLSVPHIGVQSMQDRFTSPRPTFQATSNQNAIEAITPKEKDTTPSLSVVERLEQSGNIYLASLLEEAQKKAKEHATLASARAHERLRTRRESAPVVEDDSEKLPTFNEPDVPVVAANKFQPSDVLDDMTFIRKTRDGNVHTTEMQALFWANGGEKHMVGGLSYAQAFDNLRREKMRKLQGEKAASTPYQRHTTLIPGAKVMTPGMPSQRDRDRKRNAQVRATRIVANEVWAGIKK